MSSRPFFNSVVSKLPNTVPFIAPEQLERRSGERLRLRLGANENAFGPSPRAIKAMSGSAREACLYGDPEGFILREAIAAREGVEIHEVMLGEGIDGLMMTVARATLEPGDAVVATQGTYPTFKYCIEAVGAQLHGVPYKDDANDLQALAAKAAETDAKVVYLPNPDNPSGSWFDPSTLRAFREQLPEGCVLWLDEAYQEYAPQAFPFTTHDHQVIRFRTFSKAYGLAGMRVGYLLADKEWMNGLDRIRLHFGVGRISQVAALAALNDQDYIRETIAHSIASRSSLQRLAVELGLPSLPSATNFVLFDLGTPTRAEAMLTELLDHGVFVRRPPAPPLDRLIRITCPRLDEVEPLRLALSEALDHVNRNV